MIYVCRLPDWAEQEPRQRVRFAHAAAVQLLEKGFLREYGLKRDDLWYARTAKGKPYLAGEENIDFNVTHCSGLAACVIADTPVGIDAERMGKRRMGAQKRAFTTEEQRWIEEHPCPDEAFFRLWTLKESFVKAVGTGLSYGLDRVPIRMEKDGTLSCSVPDFRFEQRILWGEYVLSVCMKNEKK